MPLLAEEEWRWISERSGRQGDAAYAGQGGSIQSAGKAQKISAVATDGWIGRERTAKAKTRIGLAVCVLPLPFFAFAQVCPCRPLLLSLDLDFVVCLSLSFSLSVSQLSHLLVSSFWDV